MVGAVAVLITLAGPRNDMFFPKLDSSVRPCTSAALIQQLAFDSDDRLGKCLRRFLW
jgi:hypothetical protein